MQFGSIAYFTRKYEDAKIMFDALKKLKDVVVFEPFEKYLDAVNISLK